MFKTIGIDASLTGTGVVVLDGDDISWSQRIDTKLKGMERLIFIEERLKHIIKQFSPTLVLIEGYAFSAKGLSYQIGELGGVIRMMLHKHEVRWIEIPPAQVKKFATGKGNAQKDFVMLNVYKKWGAEFSSNDEADAFVLAKIGQALIDYECVPQDILQRWQREYAQYQVEVLEAVKKKFDEIMR